MLESNCEADINRSLKGYSIYVIQDDPRGHLLTTQPHTSSARRHCRKGLAFRVSMIPVSGAKVKPDPVSPQGNRILMGEEGQQAFNVPTGQLAPGFDAGF